MKYSEKLTTLCFEKALADLDSDGMRKQMQKPYTGLRVGDTVKVSSEEPIYQDFNGKRIDVKGMQGKIVKLVSGGKKIILKISQGEFELPVAYLNANTIPARESFREASVNYSVVGSANLTKLRKVFKRDATAIQKLEGKLWDKMGVTSGTDLQKRWNEYKKLLKQEIKGKVNPYFYAIFEDDNYHSLNRALDELNLWDNSNLDKYTKQL